MLPSRSPGMRWGSESPRGRRFSTSTRRSAGGTLHSTGALCISRRTSPEWTIRGRSRTAGPLSRRYGRATNISSAPTPARPQRPSSETTSPSLRRTPPRQIAPSSASSASMNSSPCSGCNLRSNRSVNSSDDRQEPGGVGPRRRVVQACGQTLTEGLVRPLGVVALPKPIEAPLLGGERASRGPRGLGLERLVHPLVPAILLGVGRLDELGLNAEPDPPDRERREPSQRVRGERRAVVRADPLGQPVAVKQARKDGPTGLDGRLQQTAAAEQKAGRGVLDRQRVAVDAVPGPGLPFEIGGPDRVRLVERGVRSASVKAAARRPAATGATMPLENAVHRGHRRDELDRDPLRQQPADLPRAPAIATLQGEDLLDDRRGRRVRAAVGSVRAIDQTGGAHHLVALEPLVARLPAPLVNAPDLRHPPTQPKH